MSMMIRGGFLVPAMLLACGCANQLSARISPGTTLGGIREFYVVKLPADNLGVNDLICTRLSTMGYEAATGAREDKPPSASALITYTYQRAWDFSMYMLRLTINIEKASDGSALASGTALHSSLSRRKPSEMVAEILREIFKKAG